MDELAPPQLKIQSQSVEQVQVRAFSHAQQKIIDQIVLSPLEKYSKHNRFPWQIVLTAVMILCATLTVQSTVQSDYPQQREVQIFFNFHLLQHDSYDIYQGSTVFTWQTHQYRNFQEMYDFFSRVLDTLQGINDVNFYNVNEQKLNQSIHTIKRIYRDGTINITEYTLPELIDSDHLSVGLKDYLRNVNMMKMELDVPQISSGLEKVLLVLDIEIKQKFMMFVQVKTECVKNLTNQAQYKNLKIRKLPGKHDKLCAPPNLNAIAATVLFLLTLHSMFLRYDAYRQHPIFIDGVSKGQPFGEMSFLEKLNFLGLWNIVMLLLCLGTFIGDGLAVLLCWIQLVRYLEYTKNPFLISFLLRKVLPIQAALLLNVMIVLSGYVMFSMVVFVETKKFQGVRFAYFNYLFNNFQYGIYENFIALGPYGGFYQMLYYALLFFMVSCANQMLPSFLVNYVLSRSRYEGLQQFIRGLQIPCPVCKRITNTSPRKAERASQSDIDESEVKIAVTSPKFSPFLTPSTIPLQPGRKLVLKKQSKKRTLFKIQQDIEAPKNNARFALIMSKSQLLMSRFEECILNLQINKQPKYAKHLRQWLQVSLVKTGALHSRVDKLGVRYTQHIEAILNTP